MGLHGVLFAVVQALVEQGALRHVLAVVERLAKVAWPAASALDLSGVRAHHWMLWSALRNRPLPSSASPVAVDDLVADALARDEDCDAGARNLFGLELARTLQWEAAPGRRGLLQRFVRHRLFAATLQADADYWRPWLDELLGESAPRLPVAVLADPEFEARFLAAFHGDGQRRVKAAGRALRHGQRNAEALSLVW